MKTFYSFLLVFAFGAIVAQTNPKITFGKVEPSEMEMKFCSLDSSAEAVLLYEKETIKFTYEQEIIMETHYYARFKVLKKSGTDRGIITLNYRESRSGRSELIEDISGNTFNVEDGVTKKYKLEKSSVFSEKLADRLFRKTITMPNVKEGSVFEYSFVRRTPFAVSATPNTWYFQSDIPFLWSELNITIPDYYHYEMLLWGYLNLHINKVEEGGQRFGLFDVTNKKHTLVMKDAIPFRQEKYMSSMTDYISKVDFELSEVVYPNSPRQVFSKSWLDVRKYLMESDHFGRELKNENYLKSVPALPDSITDSAEKINTLFKYVNQSIKWNSSYGVFVSDNLKKVLENKTGSASEINLLLVMLLRKNGFDANPVLLSTRGNGEILERFPSLERFDYSVAQVKLNGKNILMDATEPLAAPGMLPQRCLSKSGLLITKDTCILMPLKPEAAHSILEVTAIELDSNTLQLKGSSVITYGGYAGLDKRSTFEVLGEQAFVKNIRELNSDYNLQNILFENQNEPGERFKIAYTFSEENSSNQQASLIYIRPVFFEKEDSNPFNLKDRIYPIDFVYPYNHVLLSTIKIPKGYTVDETPKSYILSLPDKAGKFTYLIEKDAESVRIKYQFNLSKFYFLGQEYKSLQDFFTQILQKQSEPIILKKIKP